MQTSVEGLIQEILKEEAKLYKELRLIEEKLAHLRIIRLQLVDGKTPQNDPKSYFPQ